MSRILIAVDEGPTSEKVAKAGFKLGKDLNAEVAIISVVNTELLMTDGTVTPKQMADLIRIDFVKKQKMLVDELSGDKKIWTFVEEGKPSDTILKVAAEWQADVLVLGTHGRTGLKHLLMGSVAEKVIRHATIPLFIIPTK